MNVNIIASPLFKDSVNIKLKDGVTFVWDGYSCPSRRNREVLWQTFTSYNLWIKKYFVRFLNSLNFVSHIVLFSQPHFFLLFNSYQNSEVETISTLISNKLYNCEAMPSSVLILVYYTVMAGKLLTPNFVPTVSLVSVRLQVQGTGQRR